MAHGGRARGEMGRGTREQCGSNKGALVPPSLKNRTTGLIWLVTRVGGWGEAWGGGPWRAGKGGDGGGQKMHWFPFLGSLKNLTTGLIWLVTRVGGCKGGEGGGGGTREQCGSKRCTGGQLV